MMGRMSPLKGNILLGRGVAREMVCLPQAAELDLSFPISTFDLVALGAWHRMGAWRGVDAQGVAAIEDVLRLVGLSGAAQMPVEALSGGQLRRALFARLMLREAQVILLDEPFAAVDHATTEDLLALLHAWHGEGRTIIAVLHDLDMVRAFFPQTLMLAGQVVAWGHTEQALSTEHLHLARHHSSGLLP